MTCICRHKDIEHKHNKNGFFGGCNYKTKRTKCKCKKYECGHWNLKKNYPYGRNSNPIYICKDCKKMVTRKMLKDRNLKVRGRI